MRDAGCEMRDVSATASCCPQQSTAIGASTIHVLPLLIAFLILAPLRATAREPEPAPSIPENEIASLQTELNRRAPGASSVDRRRTCKSIMRKGEALLEAHPAAPNRFTVLGILLQSQKMLVGLEATDRNREALFATCSRLTQAPDEYAGLRLEADLLLSERDLAAKDATVAERAQALKDLIAHYRATAAEAKSLMIAVLIAGQLQDLELRETIVRTMETRLQGDHTIIEYRRKALSATYLDAVFSGIYERADGTSLTFPIDRMGHTSLIYFWSKETPDIDERLGDVKALQEKFPGQFEVYSFNVDELPDAGEKQLRDLGLDWTAMRLPGGRKNSAYRAYAMADPNAVLVNAYGHTVLVPPLQYPGIPLMPTEGKQGARQAGPAPTLEQSLDDERYLAQLQSLFTGDVLVCDPFAPLHPAAPPELKMGSMDGGKNSAAGLSRTAESVPAKVLENIQNSFTVPPFRYRMSSAKALAGYERTEKLCRDAVTQYPKAPDLWLVRNRRIIALLGMWNLACEPKYLEEAVREAKGALAMHLPRGGDVVSRFCLAKEALRRGDRAESVLPAFIEATGGVDAPASAFAAAAILALDANARDLHSRYRSKLLDAPDDGNPLLWPVASFLRDQHHTYRIFHATHGRSGFTREQRHDKRRNVAALDRPADTSRMMQADFHTLRGDTFSLPGDTVGKLTLVYFMELPADEESAAFQKELVRDREDANVIAALLSDDTNRVRELAKTNEWTCETVMVPGGLRNPLVLRYGIVNADRVPNVYLLRPDGTISWSVSGLPYKIQSGGIAYAIQLAEKANITVCKMEGALAVLEKGKFQEAVRRFSEELAPGGKSRKADWWDSFQFYHRAKAYMGLENWEAALADIDVAIKAHRIFSVGNTFHCARIAEMELAKATVLEKLGRTAEAEEARARAAAPTFEHPRIPFGLYGDDSELKRLSPH